MTDIKIEQRINFFSELKAQMMTGTDGNLLSKISLPEYLLRSSKSLDLLTDGLITGVITDKEYTGNIKDLMNNIRIISKGKEEIVREWITIEASSNKFLKALLTITLPEIDIERLK